MARHLILVISITLNCKLWYAGSIFVVDSEDSFGRVLCMSTCDCVILSSILPLLTKACAGIYMCTSTQNSHNHLICELLTDHNKLLK